MLSSPDPALINADPLAPRLTISITSDPSPISMTAEPLSVSIEIVSLPSVAEIEI